MPTLALNIADIYHLVGRYKIEAEILSVMFYPKDISKRSAFANSLAMRRTYEIADLIDGAGASLLDITIASSARNIVRDILPFDIALAEATKPLVRSSAKTKIRSASLHPGKVAGIVFRDFIAAETEQPGKARLGVVIENLSKDIKKNGVPLNSGTEDLKAAWGDFKTVAHLWAALDLWAEINSTAECVPTDSASGLGAFLSSAEMLLLIAGAIRIKHAGPFISIEDSWRAPAVFNNPQNWVRKI